MPSLLPPSVNHVVMYLVFVACALVQRPVQLKRRTRRESVAHIRARIAERKSAPGRRLNYLSKEILDLMDSPLLTKDEEFELGCLVRAFVTMEATRAALTNATDQELASACGYPSLEAYRAARAESLEARDLLLFSNMKLVVALATRELRVVPVNSMGVDRDGLSIADLVSEGVLGLAKAIERYEPERGFRFSTYATWWIRSNIKQAIAARCVINIPPPVHNLAWKVKTTAERLEEELGRPPTPAEFFVASGLTHAQIQLAMRASEGVRSLDLPVGRTSVNNENGGDASGNTNDDQAGSPFYDLIPCPDPEPEEVLAFCQVRQDIDDAMRSLLKPKERDVLRLRLGLDDGALRSRREVSSIFGQSVMAIRQVERAALIKLRSDLRCKQALETIDSFAFRS